MANQNDKNLAITQAQLDELLGGISSISKSSEQIDTGIRALKNPMDILQKAISVQENSMSFMTKSMNTSFKSMLSLEQKRLQAQAKLSQEQNDLNDLSQELDKVILKMKKAADKSGKDITKDANYLLALQRQQSVQRHQEELNSIKSEDAYRRQCYSKFVNTAVNVLTSASNTIIKAFTDSISSAYNGINSAWENNYGTISSYNSYNQQQFNAMYDNIEKFIKDNNISGAVNMEDYLNEIKGVLQGGLTGNTATTVAKYGVLAKTSGINLDFSDPAFLKSIYKMEKSGQDVEAYMKTIIGATQGVIDSTGNSFGFANGQVNSMSTSLSDLAMQSNMSSSAMNKAYKAMAAFTGTVGDTNFDASKLFSVINDYAKTGITNKSQEALLGLNGMTGSEFSAYLNENGIEGIINNMMHQYYTTYAGKETEFMSIASEALGSVYSADELKSLFGSLPTESDFQTAFTNALNSAETPGDERISKLEDFVPVSEKFQNNISNVISSVNQWAQKSYLLQVLMQSGISTLISLAAVKGDGNIASGLKTLFGKGTAGTSALSSLGSVFSNGSAAGIGKYIFSTGGKALGMAGGLISAGFDAYSGFQNDGVEGAIIGALTGKTKTIDSGWGVASTAVSNGLKGAAIGMVGGPLGAAIGGATGLILGLGASIADLTDKEKQYSNTLNKLSDLSSSLADNQEKQKERLSEYSDVVSLTNKAKQGDLTATSELVKLYPQLIENLSESGTLQGDYNKTLELILAQEERKLYNSSLSEYSSDIANSGVKLKGSTSISNTAKVSATKFTSASTVSAAEGAEYSTESKKYKVGTDRYGAAVFSYKNSKGRWVDNYWDRTYDSLPSEIKSAFAAGGIDKTTFDSMGLSAALGYLQYYGILDSNTMNFENSSYAKDYRLWKDSALDVTTAIDTILSGLKDSMISMPPEMFAAYNDENKYPTWNRVVGTADEEDVIKGFSAFFQYLNALKTYSSDPGTAKYLKSQGISYDEIASQYKNGSPLEFYNRFKNSASFISDAPPFKSGLAYVPYDNYPALLHQGERVQTAAEASIDRTNSSRQSAMSPSLITALDSQTQSIVDVLNKIYDLLRGSSGQDTYNQTVNYSLPSNA